MVEPTVMVGVESVETRLEPSTVSMVPAAPGALYMFKNVSAGESKLKLLAVRVPKSPLTASD
jgi:hypothetical protein